MRCLVAVGIEVATGELLRTMDTVAGERLRCSASILSVAGLLTSGSFFFSVIALRGMDVQDIAIVVHLGREGCQWEIRLRKFCQRSIAMKNYKIETKEGVD